MTTTIKKVLAMAGLVIAANAAYSLYPSSAAAEPCSPGGCNTVLDCSKGCSACSPNPFCYPMAGCCIST
jgi:hypothetical protein